MNRAAFWQAALLAAAMAFTWPAPLMAAEPGHQPVPALALRAVDGDTLDVLLADGAAERVRVYGINAPERADPFFAEAKRFTASFVQGARLTITPMGRDKFGRLLAFVEVEDGARRRSLGLELLRAGLAVVYSTRYRPISDDIYKAYQLAQMEAMTSGLGVWAVISEGEMEMAPRHGAG